MFLIHFSAHEKELGALYLLGDTLAGESGDWNTKSAFSGRPILPLNP